MRVFELLGKAIVPAAVIIAFAFFRKRYPNSPARLTQREIEGLDYRFQGMKWLPQFFMVLIGIIFVFSTHAALVALNKHFASANQSPAIFLLPQTAIWWFFPGFGALTLSWELTLQIGNLVWGRPLANLYSDWSDATRSYWGQGSQFDSRKVLRLLAVVIALPIGILTALALPMHATITQERITDCGYAFKTCQTYLLTDARRITAIKGFRTKDGELTPRAGLVINFKDGRHWSSADWGNFKTEIDPTLAEMLTRATGLPIGAAGTEQDIPQ